MTNAQKAFEGLLDRYFETVLAWRPVAATYAGLSDGEGRLGNATREQEAREQAWRLRTLAALDRIPPRDLTGDQHLDRLALRARLLRESEDHVRGLHRLNPAALDTVLNILLHELQRGEDQPRRAAANVRSLLRAIPGHLAEAARLCTRPEATWLRVMQGNHAGAASLLAAVGVFLGRHGSRPEDARWIAEAQRAMDRYRDAVSHREPAPEGSFALGAGALQRRIRDELGLDYTLGEVESLAEAEIERVGQLLARACARFGRNRPAGEIVAEARQRWRPSIDLVELYRRETARVADGFRAVRAVSFPDRESLVVSPVPEFMRALFPTAAYKPPAPFERRLKGVFWVNDLGATKASESERLAERQQHFGLSLTCAHEAYPGHHLQFVTAYQHPRRWRRLFEHAVFYEGWTLWCEQMMVDLRVERSPWLKVQQLHDALWRCHRILVDLRLQTGRYGAREGARHLQRHLGFTGARAEAEINWYTAAPAVPMSYWLGRLENARLHRRLVAGRGWRLRRFNDWLLSFGTLPQSWLEKYGLD